MRNEILNSKNPCLIYVNGIGDHILTLPTIRALAELFKGNLTLVCKSGYKELLFNDIELKYCLEIPFRVSGESYIFDIDNVYDKIKDCDFFISLIPWENTCVKSLFEKLNPKTSLGFCSYFSHYIPIDVFEHSSDTSFRLAKFFDSNINIENYTYPPYICEKSYSIANEIRDAIPQSYKILVLHGDTQGDKVWPNQKYYSMLDRLLDLHQKLVVVVIGKQFLSFTRCKYKDRIVREFLDLPLDVTFAIIKNADVYLGVDSCFLHIADLFMIPSVGLFGPTSEIEWGFKWTKHQHIRSESGDMCDISSDSVFNALQVFL